ncbi:MAG: hypothetical protein H6832_17965 [Planctomycetes bacterium]|nr:hypothetical protein [Planctomycetota bacterium]MCB9920292.1 hypothetical protein [Planctomycetota bacterium]
MLPHKDLAAYYDKVTWLFVSRNFKKDEKDREALRTHDRFGISSWPQLVLFDPRDDTVLEQMSRELDSFKKQLKKHVASVPPPPKEVQDKIARLRRAKALMKQGETLDALRRLESLAKEPDAVDVWLEAREILRHNGKESPTLAERLADPDVRERAIAIEEVTLLEDEKERSAFEAAIEERLFDDDEHLIVKLRALAFLAPTRGAEIAKRAGELLSVPNDPFRYAALALLKEHPNPRVAEQLARLYAGAGTTIPSGNPNVLRSHTASAIATCGDESAIAPIEAFLREVMPNNGTLGASLDALAGVASRAGPGARTRIVAIVLENFPGPVEDARYAAFDSKWMARRLPQIAKQFHTTLVAVSEKRDLPAPPAEWSRELRSEYLRTLKTLLH